MQWNFNMDEAPRGHFRTVKRTIDGIERNWEEHVPEKIIAAIGDGQSVTTSYWIPKEERWCMFSKKVGPIAWMPWPKHPEAEA